MKEFHELRAIIWASYLNKIRTYRFLIILGLVIVAGYVFVPAPEAHYVTLGWGSSTTFYRGIYNSAWVGAMIALLTGLSLALFGFYVVNDNVKRDEDTQVGQIIATTPISNSVYTLGNALSSFAVLTTMVIIIILTAVGMQIFYGEEIKVNLVTLCSPFIVFVIPVILLVASLAIFFESVPSLRGSTGNILYVVIWLFGIPILSDRFDLIGNNFLISSMRDAGQTAFPALSQNEFTLGYAWGFPEGRTLATFTWHGIIYSSELLQSRLLLLCLAIGISLVASFRFSRFNPDYEFYKVSGVPQENNIDVKDIDDHENILTNEIKLMSLDEDSYGFHLLPMLLAEFQLVFNELQISIPFGLIVAILMIITGFVLPLETAKNLFLPIAWVTPVLIWSKLGSRETRHQTDQLVFSSANPISRQLSALWLTGVLVSILTGGGVALNLVFHGDWLGIVAWFVGALFIPSLALCLGVWTHTKKIFEFLYILLLYIGPINGVTALDFMGILPESIEIGVWKVYLIFTFILICLSIIGRKQQIQRN